MAMQLIFFWNAVRRIVHGNRGQEMSLIQKFKVIGFLSLALSVVNYSQALWAATALSQDVCQHLLKPRSEFRPFPEAKPLRGQRAGQSVTFEPRWNPIQKISVVVPIYRELRNGNLAQFLESLGAQKLDPDLFEVVFVVNNNKSIAAQLNHPTRIENQDTIRFLRQYKAPFKVRTLDLASEGIETNMGILRHLGVQEALRYSPDDKSKHVIVHMDADTIFDAQFLLEEYTLYSRYAFGAVLVQRTHRLDPNADDLTMKTFYKYMTGEMMYKFQQSLFYARYGAATPQISSRASTYLEVGGIPLIPSNEDFEFTKRLVAGTVYFYAPDIHVYAQDRAREDGFDARIRKNWNDGIMHFPPEAVVGGVPSEPLIETTMMGLMRRLSKDFSKNRMTFSEMVDQFISIGRSNCMIDSNTGMVPEFEPDCWGQLFGILRKFLNEKGGDDLVYSSCALFDQEFAFLSLSQVFSNQLTVDCSHSGSVFYHLLFLSVGALGSDLGVQMNDEIWGNQRSHEYLRSQYLDILNDLIYHQTLPHFEKCQRLSKDILGRALCDPSSRIRLRIKELQARFMSSDDQMAQIIEEYPDWLKDFWKTPYKRGYVSYGIASRWLLRAHNQPEISPVISKMYEDIFRRDP